MWVYVCACVCVSVYIYIYIYVGVYVSADCQWVECSPMFVETRFQSHVGSFTKDTKNGA